MARIYKCSDRIPVRIDDVVVTLAPLSLDQKTEIQQAMFLGSEKGDLRELTRAIKLSMRYSVKSISGVEDADGLYQLKFENGILTDECVDDLMNMEITPKLARVVGQLTQGVPSQFTDEKNQALKGVEIIKAAKEAPAKKS